MSSPAPAPLATAPAPAFSTPKAENTLTRSPTRVGSLPIVSRGSRMLPSCSEAPAPVGSSAPFTLS